MLKELTPEDQEKLNRARLAFKQKYNMPDADWEKHVSYACNRNLLLNRDRLRKYKIFAEVVESRYCGAGIKVGQKYVFQTIPNLLLVAESDCPLCLKALGPVSELIHGIWDRMVEGLDPNDSMGQFARCLDPGVNYGGLGSVIMKVYAREI
jgi:uncharacterized repeat protein (TIGR04076 family)